MIFVKWQHFRFVKQYFPTLLVDCFFIMVSSDDFKHGDMENAKELEICLVKRLCLTLSSIITTTLKELSICKESQKPFFSGTSVFLVLFSPSFIILIGNLMKSLSFSKLILLIIMNFYLISFLFTFTYFLTSFFFVHFLC